uniref:Transcriptional adapter 1 n=1 Tax=Noccaea caerulescens TaxID=107243 RepID=A0A1J3CJM9_NOCCA
MQRVQDPRIDLAEMKLHIVKKIGAERCRRYFYYLGRFLSQKLTKSEFDKSCHRLLGRENLALHNKLIRSILRNASMAKSPPAVHKSGHPDRSVVLGQDDGSLVPNHNRNDPVWSNGVLPKVRPGNCDRAMRDRLTPLGPNGKVETLLHQPLCREDRNTVNNNGDLGPLAYQRSGRYADKGQVAASVSREDEAHEERGGRLILSKSPVIAPLGIPFCSRRTVPVSTTAADFISCYDSGGLSETEMLRKRMENIAVAQGLGGVSAECSTMLNNILDVYLKKLIKSCVDLAGARSMNGVRPSIQTSNQPSYATQEQHSVSLLDFRVAMELNPHQLGEDWPLLRERIFMRSLEEREGV